MSEDYGGAASLDFTIACPVQRFKFPICQQAQSSGFRVKKENVFY